MVRRRKIQMQHGVSAVLGYAGVGHLVEGRAATGLVLVLRKSAFVEGWLTENSVYCFKHSHGTRLSL